MIEGVVYPAPLNPTPSMSNVEISQDVPLQDQSVDNNNPSGPINNSEAQGTQGAREQQVSGIKAKLNALKVAIGAAMSAFGLGAIGTAIVGVLSSVAAVGFVAAFTPVVPLLLFGAIGLYAGIQFIQSGLAKENTNNVNQNTQNTVQENSVKVEKSPEQIEKDGEMAFNSLLDTIQKKTTKEEINKLFSDEQFKSNLHDFGEKLMASKEKVLQLLGDNYDPLSVFMNTLMPEAQSKIESLQNALIEKGLSLTECKQQLGEAFTTVGLNGNPLESIQNTLIETGGKILNNAFVDGNTIDQTVFDELTNNITKDNKEGLFNNMRELARRINDDHEKGTLHYKFLNNIFTDDIKHNFNGIFKMYTDIQTNQPTLFKETFDAPNTTRDIKDMYFNLANEKTMEGF
ncbi:MAG: hypothetical protein MJ218_00505 [Opitutales bacterium]|nr:hypothetical protein [Opitutales bacterium]